MLVLTRLSKTVPASVPVMFTWCEKIFFFLVFPLPRRALFDLFFGTCRFSRGQLPPRSGENSRERKKKILSARSPRLIDPRAFPAYLHSLLMYTASAAAQYTLFFFFQCSLRMHLFVTNSTSQLPPSKERKSKPRFSNQLIFGI